MGVVGLLRGGGRKGVDLSGKTSKRRSVFFFSKEQVPRGTSDATTSSSFILQLFTTLQCQSISFHPQKQPYLAFENNWGRTDGRTDGPTDTASYRDARTYLKTGEPYDKERLKEQFQLENE